jgi:hypothetical protein
MIAAGWCLAASCAEAQLQEQPTPPLLQSAVAPYSKLFANSAGPFPRLYQGERETTTAFDPVFDSYRTDPKLMFGVELRPNLAVETGYANLFSRGFHYVDYGRSDERAGALGTKGFSSYLAGKIRFPLVINSQLMASWASPTVSVPRMTVLARRPGKSTSDPT